MLVTMPAQFHVQFHKKEDMNGSATLVTVI